MKKVKEWPKNLTAKEIRERMEGLADLISSYENEYEAFERELEDRGLKV